MNLSGPLAHYDLDEMRDALELVLACGPYPDRYVSLIRYLAVYGYARVSSCETRDESGAVRTSIIEATLTPRGEALLEHLSQP